MRTFRFLLNGPSLAVEVPDVLLALPQSKGVVQLGDDRGRECLFLPDFIASTADWSDFEVVDVTTSGPFDVTILYAERAPGMWYARWSLGQGILLSHALAAEGRPVIDEILQSLEIVEEAGWSPSVMLGGRANQGTSTYPGYQEEVLFMPGAKKSGDLSRDLLVNIARPSTIREGKQHVRDHALGSLVQLGGPLDCELQVAATTREFAEAVAHTAADSLEMA